MRTTPRRRAQPLAARLRPFWIVFLLLAVLGGWGLAAFVRWPLLRPHRIEVRGERVVPPGEILRAADIAMHRNLWLQDTGAMERRIDAIPYVLSARIRRYWPATVVIEVTERTPVAILQADGRRWLVDDALRILQPAPPAAHGPVLEVTDERGPLMQGSSAATAQSRVLLEVLRALQGMRLGVAAIRTDDFGDIAVTLRGRRMPELLLGSPDGLDTRLSLVEPLLERALREPRRVAAIDLRAGDAPVFVFAR
jgi:cell division protein FtsQ